MQGLVSVGKVADLPPGQMTWVAVNRERVLLANVAGIFYAISDTCGHQRVALSKGRLDGYAVECPLHFARYDLRTGELISGPMAEDVLVYAVRVEGETVYVKQEPEV